MVARKKSPLETKIYSYGARAPKTEMPHITWLLKQQIRYYNTLIEIENLRRIWFGELEVLHSPDLAQAEKDYETQDKAVDALYEQCRQYRSTNRTTRITDELKESLRVAKQQRSLAVENRKQAKAKHRMLYKPADGEFDRRVTELLQKSGLSGPLPRERFNEQVRTQMLNEPEWPLAWKHQEIVAGIVNASIKSARAASNLPHGTYSLAEEAFAAAAKKTRAGNLKFKRLPLRDDPIPVTSSGRIGIQIQGGLSIDDVLAGTDSRLRIEVLPHRPEDAGRSKNWVKLHTYALLHMRIDTDTRVSRVAVIPFSYHRPIPPGAVIKRAWLLVNRDGYRTRYDVQFTIEVPPTVSIGKRAQACAINMGWRSVGNGNTRVGFLVGTDGFKREFLIEPRVCRGGEPRTISDAIAFADQLRSASDTHFNAARDALAGALSQLADSSCFYNDREAIMQIVRDCRHIHHWRSHRKLQLTTLAIISALGLKEQCDLAWSEWKNLRLANSHLDLFDSFQVISEFVQRDLGSSDKNLILAVYLNFWTIKDRHLGQWENDQRARVRNRRNKLFERWAKEISERYAFVILESEGLAEHAKKPEADQSDSGSGARKAQANAAPSKFKEAIVSKLGRGSVAEEDAHFNTRTCHICGYINESWDTKGSHVHSCGSCSATIDQDENNACNLLQKRFPASGDLSKVS